MMQAIQIHDNQHFEEELFLHRPSMLLDATTLLEATTLQTKKNFNKFVDHIAIIDATGFNVDYIYQPVNLSVVTTTTCGGRWSKRSNDR